MSTLHKDGKHHEGQMTIQDILGERHFLRVDVGDGSVYALPIYSHAAIDLMYAAMRMDGWLLREVGYVPQDRLWWVDQPRARNRA